MAPSAALASRYTALSPKSHQAGAQPLRRARNTRRGEDEAKPASLRAPRAHDLERRRPRRNGRSLRLLVVPGLELTYNDFDPLRAAHALAIGLRSYVAIDQGLDESLRGAREEGAAIVAAHPYRTTEAGPTPARTTQRFSRDWRELDELVDRYELFNRTDIFAWVAERGLPGVATGDFHRPEHFAGWKTLVPCTKSEQALLDYLRSRRPVYLSQLGSAALRPADGIVTDFPDRLERVLSGVLLGAEQMITLGHGHDLGRLGLAA